MICSLILNWYTRVLGTREILFSLTAEKWVVALSWPIWYYPNFQSTLNQ